LVCIVKKIEILVRVFFRQSASARVSEYGILRNSDNYSVQENLITLRCESRPIHFNFWLTDISTLPRTLFTTDFTVMLLLFKSLLLNVFFRLSRASFCVEFISPISAAENAAEMQHALLFRAWNNTCLCFYSGWTSSTIDIRVYNIERIMLYWFKSIDKYCNNCPNSIILSIHTYTHTSYSFTSLS
jgi:hypothetical protein